MDGLIFRSFNITSSIDWFTQDIENPTQGGFAHWNQDRGSYCCYGHTPFQSIRRIHGNGTDKSVTQMALHLKYQCFITIKFQF
jgi:hypothetical protein